MMNEAGMTFFHLQNTGMYYSSEFYLVHFCALVFKRKYKHNVKFKVIAMGNDLIRKVPKLVKIIR